MSDALRAGPLAAALAFALTLAGCGGGGSEGAGGGSVSLTRTGHGATSPATAASNPSARPPSLRPSATVALPGAVQLPAVTPWRGGALALAGLDAADSSLASVTFVSGGRARTMAQLPAPLHDAAAASVGGRAYLFGGGNASVASSAILDVGETGAREAGHLPAPASDVAAAAIGNTAYVVGGYTETEPLRTIVAFTPGGTGSSAGPQVRVVGLLPRPLRYAAVAAVGERLLIVGGTSGETAQRAILSFDPADGRVRRIGELSHPLTHAAGAALNGWMYVLGGRGESLSSQTPAILAIDPANGSVHAAGRLPEALSDIGATTLAGAGRSGSILAVGGRNAAGTVRDSALVLVPRTG